MPPVLTFQSVVDFTLSTPAILSAPYAHLPANGSELVLFDLNRAAIVGPLMRNAADYGPDAHPGRSTAEVPDGH